jgi:hypothetical protein
MRHRQHRAQHLPQPPKRRSDQQSMSAAPRLESERIGARTSRTRQAEPGSRVTVTVAAVGKVPAVYCDPKPWSEPWEQPEIAWRRPGGVLVMPNTRNHQRNAGACDYSREGWTGSKFEMKIWTRFGRSRLDHLQTKETKTILTLTKNTTFVPY